jgi:hypothetical protein
LQIPECGMIGILLFQTKKSNAILFHHRHDRPLGASCNMPTLQSLRESSCETPHSMPAFAEQT